MAANDVSDRAVSKGAAPPKKPLSAAAERALAEAAARRAAAEQQKSKSAAQPKETQGRDGLDPTRYGDWEVKGVASDF